MEQQREDGQTDYWLVQYQRLLDKKPQALIDKVGCVSVRMCLRVCMCVRVYHVSVFV